MIRVPAVARVPQGPAALLGIANLRGAVLPVAGLRQLLGQAEAATGASARAIVLDIGAPIAVVVDSVAALEYASQAQIDTRPKEVGADGAEKLLGALAVARGQGVAKILDIKAMLEAAFANRGRTPQRDTKLRATARAHEEKSAAEESETLVTFDVAGQEFALPLTDVQEIIQAPASVTGVAHSEAVVIGLTAVRDALLPLLSLRALLGFPARQAASDRKRSWWSKSVARKSGSSPTAHARSSPRTRASSIRCRRRWRRVREANPGSAPCTGARQAVG